MLGGEPSAYGWIQVAGLAVFLGTVVSRAITLRVGRRINPVALRLRKRGWLGIAEIALFITVNVWVAAVLAYSLGIGGREAIRVFGPRLINSLAARLVGMAMILVGFVVFFLGLIALGPSWRLGLDESDPGQLVTGGIYALSRNPIYLFFDLWFVGTFLVNGGMLFLVLAVLTIANLHYQVIEEEKFLARVHGAAYGHYQDRTARYLRLRLPARDRDAAARVTTVSHAAGPQAVGGNPCAAEAVGSAKHEEGHSV